MAELPSWMSDLIDKNDDSPREMDYREYIASPEWREIAAEAKRLAGFRCRLCNRSADEVTLQVHHRTYERLCHESQDDLTVLCKECHQNFHDHQKSLKEEHLKEIRRKFADFIEK